MTFQWPLMLMTMLALPFLAAAYRRRVQRASTRRHELAALGLVASAAGSALGRRRHVAPALLLLCLALLFVALARPQARVADPRREGTVILAFDVSNSMAATDLTPTRMEAAKAAARAFVARQPSTIRVGVVAFGESGVVTQQPTVDRSAVIAAIDRLSPQAGTALGRGIQTSLSAIAGGTVQLNAPSGSVEATIPDLGYHGSAAVILLSDGENTTDPDPLEAAQLASTAGVRIYPIGLGSAQGSVLQIDGFQVATSLDEPLLRQIASTTNGQYFAAADGPALTRVYDAINLVWTVKARQMEVTALFAAAAALCLLVAAVYSFVSFGRVL